MSLSELVVAVGSTNPNKVAAVETVFKAMMTDVKRLEVVGVKVDSGVKEQPLSDEETFQGAQNRARRALEAVKLAEYGVGIEGGLQQYPFGWHEKQWVVIINRDGLEGAGSTPGPLLPDKFISEILTGKSLDQVMEPLTGIPNIGQKQGMFGFITNDFVTRASAIESGVAFALARFIHPELF